MKKIVKINANVELKILHVVQDEKFIDTAYELFEEVAPGANDFIILEKERPLKYIKKAPVAFFDSRLKIPNSVYRSLKLYSFVVLHSLHTNSKALVEKAPDEVKFVWIGFGFDYYPLFEKSKRNFLLSKTAELQEQLLHESPSPRILSRIKDFIKNTFLRKSNDEHVIGKILYFSPVIESEYELVKSSIPVAKFPAHVQWNYSSLYKSFDIYPMASGNDILVGNSASINNNHLDAFHVLSCAGVKSRRITCPLSYGGSKGYIEKVIYNGEKVFGEYFNPLFGFLDKYTYYKMILDCSYVIMNHLRQQGAGNISFMLYSGAKVFLRKENPLYANYKRLGMVLYTIEELEVRHELLHSPLSEEDAINNRKILSENKAEKVALDKTRNLIEVMCSAQ